jgi:hypothetical protein
MRFRGGEFSTGIDTSTSRSSQSLPARHPSLSLLPNNQDQYADDSRRSLDAPTCRLFPDRP